MSWITSFILKKNKVVKFKGKTTTYLPNLTNGVNWNSTECVVLNSNLSTKNNMYEFRSEIIKNNDNSFTTSFISIPSYIRKVEDFLLVESKKSTLITNTHFEIKNKVKNTVIAISVYAEHEYLYTVFKKNYIRVNSVNVAQMILDFDADYKFGNTRLEYVSNDITNSVLTEFKVVSQGGNGYIFTIFLDIKDQDSLKIDIENYVSDKEMTHVTMKCNVYCEEIGDETPLSTESTAFFYESN